MENIILDFINGFKKYHEKEITDLFSNGYCYYFAIILNERFNSVGTIMYAPVYNHFTYRMEGNLYDITGKVTDEELIKISEPWNTYKNQDNLESYRIIRDCILKTKPIEE